MELKIKLGLDGTRKLLVDSPIRKLGVHGARNLLVDSKKGNPDVKDKTCSASSRCLCDYCNIGDDTSPASLYRSLTVRTLACPFVHLRRKQKLKLIIITNSHHYRGQSNNSGGIE
jgi:hypothetical protein